MLNEDISKETTVNVPKLAISAATIMCFSGCAYYFPPTHEERIAQYKKTCESLGLKPQTTENANCVLDLEKSFLSGRGSTNGLYSPENDARTQQIIDEDRRQRQMLNHGSGGCTPNFATGGCL